MPSSLHIDFSSVIDNARFFAAREEALRRSAQPAPAARMKSGRWGAPPKAGRPASLSAPKPAPVVHAH